MVSHGPNTVAGRLRGRKAFRGAGSTLTMTRVPKGTFGGSRYPASTRYKAADARTAIPHHRVGSLLPHSRYLARLFNNGTGPLVIDVAKPLCLSHWVYVDNLGLMCLSEGELKKLLNGAVDNFNSVGLSMH